MLFSFVQVASSYIYGGSVSSQPAGEFNWFELFSVAFACQQMTVANQKHSLIQIATTGYGLHGIFVHAYLNGVYWGLYNLMEKGILLICTYLHSLLLRCSDHVLKCLWFSEISEMRRSFSWSAMGRGKLGRRG